MLMGKDLLPKLLYQIWGHGMLLLVLQENVVEIEAVAFFFQ